MDGGQRNFSANYHFVLEQFAVPPVLLHRLQRVTNKCIRFQSLEISSVGTVHVRAGEQNTSVSASTPLVHGSIVGGAPAAQRP